MEQTLTHSPLPVIRPVDRMLEAVLQAKLEGKAKPPGSLGRVEELAVQLGQIQNRPDPRIGRVLALVFAGDHGLTEEGVSRYPAAVTAAMVDVFLAGRASVNAFARAADVDVRVVDAGVDAELAGRPGLIDAKVRRGTRNAAREPAMHEDEARLALERGAAIAADAIAEGYDAIAIGEMGIGNTASAALLMHRLAAVPLDECIGRGAGQDEDGLARKRAALERAASRTPVTEPFAVLCEFGGLEIAMMAGAVLGTAAKRGVVVADGFISSAAVLVASRLDPLVLDYCVFAHRSAERGHRRMLESLGADPLLDLDLRLGEGTGAVLAVPILRAAARLINDVADLSDVIGK